jgi:S-adenosylmethionine decarboxylase proenzyme
VLAVTPRDRSAFGGGRSVETFGRHLLAEYHGCDSQVLNDRERICGLLRRAAKEAGATIVAEVYQPFAPQGVSGVVVIEESHLSVHTWPESRYAAVDFYTCGECLPEQAYRVLFTGLGATRAELMVIHRGSASADGSLRVDEHRREEAPPVAIGLAREG